MLISVEGIDGSGKATQSGILARRLDAAVFSFPQYGTEVGKVIKRHLLGLISLREEHTIDSSDHTIDGNTVYRKAPEDALVFQGLMLVDKSLAANDIRSALTGGQHVVCDRWIPSSQCYGAADGLDAAWLERMHASLPQADLNIFLDIMPEEAVRRRPEARDRYERDRAKQVAVRAEYQKLWAAGGDKYVTVDGDGGGSGDGPIFTVAERVWEVVAKRL